MRRVAGCAHCAGAGEDRLWEGDKFRVVLVRDSGFAGWCRVVWHEHVAELTDLPVDERQIVFNAVVAVELALRSELAPAKINIASLGTAMPHLHFHMIPRFSDDPTFPEPVWLPPVRQSSRELPVGFDDNMRRGLADAL